MTKILLIDPPSPEGLTILRTVGNIGTSKADVKWPPYDLMVLGGLFRKNDIHDFKIIDANNLRITYPELKKIIAKESPEFVIFLLSRNWMNYDLQLSKMVKRLNPKTKTIAIGLSIRAIENLDEVLEKTPELDIIVYSWAEIPVLNIIKSIPETAVDGIYWKKKGKVVKNQPQAPIYNNFGIPAHDKVPLKIYRDPLTKRRPMSGVRFSIGCIGSCKFCPTVPFQRPVMFRDVDNVIDELFFIQALDVKEIMFYDCTFSNNVSYAKKLLKRMIKEKFDFTWICNERADSITPELLKLMKKAGCHMIMLGSDSSSQKILDHISKRETVEQVERVVKWIKNARIELHLYATFGHPDETEITMRNTIEWIKKLDPDTASFGIVTPVPGTEFYDYLKSNGFLKENVSLESFDPMMEPVYEYPWLSSKKILEMSRRGYREFYMRPKIILKRLRNISSWGDEISNALMFFRTYIKSK